MRHGRLPGICVAALIGLAVPVSADDAVMVTDRGRDAYSQPLPVLAPERIEGFRAGRSLFRQAWLLAPSTDQPELDGLGPLFNRLSCIACHVKNGRGEPPDGPDDVMRSTLLRLSVAGTDPHGGPNPHPVYGDQLNPDGIPGVPGEGKATLRWHEHEEALAGGETIRLRRPELVVRDLAYGPLETGTMTSVRLAPPVYGLGLLEAVPEEAILALAAANGGRANRVWDVERGAPAIGRFGLKANQPSLRQQNAGALAGDIGITSRLFPNETCTPAQTACAAGVNRRRPELADTQLDALTLYVQALAVPARRGADDAEVRAGEELFAGVGCAACHAPVLTTGPHPVAELAGRTIHPYTDLLLHDLGEGLADGRPDFLAGGREWRTPPLWGIGLAEVIAGRAFYLHDGRARTLAEAILWHGGQAQAARDAFRDLPPERRAELLAFIRSL